MEKIINVYGWNVFTQPDGKTVKSICNANYTRRAAAYIWNSAEHAWTRVDGLTVDALRARLRRDTIAIKII